LNEQKEYKTLQLFSVKDKSKLKST